MRTALSSTLSSSRNRAIAAVAAAAFTVAAVAPASAAMPRYDGQWSVVIVTEKGTCDRSYRYPVRIERGALVNAGSVPVVISGKVAGNGSVTVKVAYGEKSAQGSGRLTSTSGAGYWKGGECAGTWSAERRG